MNSLAVLAEFGSPDSIRFYGANAEGRGLVLGEVWDFFVGLGCNVGFWRLKWQAGSEGLRLKSAEQHSLGPAESIGNFLHDLVWQNPVH